MRRIILLVISATILGFTAYVLYMILTTRSHSPQETTAIEHGDLKVSVTYCRPYKKGRKVFGGIVPYGDYWRTGANDATEISFSKPIAFAGTAVPPGRYRLYTYPNINEWKIVLNTELGQWGAFIPNPDLDIAKASVPTRPLGSDVEQFTIAFEPRGDSLELSLSWEKTEVIVGIR